MRSGRAPHTPDPRPQALAALRTGVVGVLRQHREPTLAATVRTHVWSGSTAVFRLLGLTFD